MSLKYNQVIITRGEEELRIPIGDIDTLLLEDSRTSLSVALLNKFVENKVNILLCDDMHNPSISMVPISGYCRQRKSITNQIAWNERIKDELWKYIVNAKISNQICVLEKSREEISHLDILYECKETVESGDFSNREALAARIYFPDLFGEDFSRGDGNAINAALNYGYAILLSCFNRTLAYKGLILALGIHHKNEYNSFNLSCDLVEPFRPFIDMWVYNNISEGEIFERNHKVALINLLNEKVVIDGRMERLVNAIEIYCNWCIKFLNNNTYMKDSVSYSPRYFPSFGIDK